MQSKKSQAVSCLEEFETRKRKKTLGSCQEGNTYKQFGCMFEFSKDLAINHVWKLVASMISKHEGQFLPKGFKVEYFKEDKFRKEQCGVEKVFEEIEEDEIIEIEKIEEENVEEAVHPIFMRVYIIKFSCKKI